ncbi:hypothetical protein B0H10DRAFT_2435979 [Mycena sp. CBHHK59/15]|nr:hypothetical protein B0H10DRAFT_2435979 [Mycena sp. CBHHK59/15]
MSMANLFLAGGSKPAKPTCAELDANQSVPFTVVLDACRILENNKDGTLRVRGADADLTAPDDEKDLLPPGRYTYHVTRGETAYAVCTSFRAWTPPSVLPSHWDFPVMGAIAAFPASSASTYSTVVRASDGWCAVTRDRSRLQNSHLVPEAEAPWWALRGMTGLTNNPKGIKSPPNCLATRADLNGKGMDQGHFAFAPYVGTAVCVCLTDGMADFAVEYHLRAVEIPARIHPMNVYVRFAWGLFRALRTVLGELSQDRVIVTEGNADGRDEEQGKDDEGPLLADDDDSPQESDDDAAFEPPLDVYTWTERDLEVAEGLDADLDGRPLVGMYRGFSNVMRLAHEYRQQHPEASAVQSARVARVGEDDDEQWL